MLWTEQSKSEKKRFWDNWVENYHISPESYQTRKGRGKIKLCQGESNPFENPLASIELRYTFPEALSNPDQVDVFLKDINPGNFNPQDFQEVLNEGIKQFKEDAYRTYVTLRQTGDPKAEGFDSPVAFTSGIEVKMYDEDRAGQCLCLYGIHYDSWKGMNPPKKKRLLQGDWILASIRNLLPAMVFLDFPHISVPGEEGAFLTINIPSYSSVDLVPDESDYGWKILMAFSDDDFQVRCPKLDNGSLLQRMNAYEEELRLMREAQTWESLTWLDEERY